VLLVALATRERSKRLVWLDARESPVFKEVREPELPKAASVPVLRLRSDTPATIPPL
jgi:hypothetical protein